MDMEVAQLRHRIDILEAEVRAQAEQIRLLLKGAERSQSPTP